MRARRHGEARPWSDSEKRRRSEESATPDLETYRACLPSLIASGGVWVGISTGYRKVGLLYAKHRDHFGVDSDDVLVVSGPTETFNPLINPASPFTVSEPVNFESTIAVVASRYVALTNRDHRHVGKDLQPHAVAV